MGPAAAAVGETDVAWLAGLWDGEGSIGITLARPSIAVQLSMTDAETVEHAVDIMQRLGIRGLGYSYREKHPERHRDAHYIRVNRQADVLLMATRLLPYSITKRRQWAAALEFVTSRLDRAEIGPDGRVRRGGRFQPKGLTTRESELIEELCQLNRRGPRPSERLSILPLTS